MRLQSASHCFFAIWTQPIARPIHLSASFRIASAAVKGLLSMTPVAPICIPMDTAPVPRDTPLMA